jgi:hypothetical protein
MSKAQRTGGITMTTKPIWKKDVGANGYLIVGAIVGMGLVLVTCQAFGPPPDSVVMHKSDIDTKYEMERRFAPRNRVYIRERDGLKYLE